MSSETGSATKDWQCSMAQINDGWETNIQCDSYTIWSALYEEKENDEDYKTSLDVQKRTSITLLRHCHAVSGRTLYSQFV